MDKPHYTLTYDGHGRGVTVTLTGAEGLRDVLDGVQSFLQAVGFSFAVGERLDVWDENESPWDEIRKERPDLWTETSETENHEHDRI